MLLIMNVTMREKVSKRQQVDQSKTGMKSKYFQLKHYEPKGILQELAFMLIRPPRFIYHQGMLMPQRRAGSRFTIDTFRIPFQLTLYKQASIRYVILYLHGNGSSRFQGTLSLPPLPDGVGLACFDFKGCGNRQEGQFITLGQQQCKDVDIAAKFLKSKGFQVVGWGRSMGAVSLLMSNECDIMIVDSAFSNLAVLCKESSSKFLPKACCCIFHCFYPCVFACIQCKTQALSGLTIGNMNVKKRLRETKKKKQICFIHGQQDTLIPSYHSQKLYDSFNGRKMIVLFEGSHNSTRSNQVLQKCFKFIDQALQYKGENHYLGNEKIIEMTNMQGKQSLSKMGLLQQKKNSSTLLTTQTKSHLKRDGQNYSNLESDISQKKSINSNRDISMKEQYCEIGLQEVVPANFCSVMDSDDLEKVPANFKSARKERLADLIFSKKRQ